MDLEELEKLYMDIYDNGFINNEYKEKFKRYINNYMPTPKKVWVVTEGDYSDNHIVGIFSSEEKANDFYNLHKEDDDEHRYTSYYAPDEYICDKITVPDVGIVEAYKHKGNWVFTVSGVVDRELEDLVIDNRIGTVHNSYHNNYYIFVNFNPDREVMKKAAQDYFYQYLARKEAL